MPERIAETTGLPTVLVVNCGNLSGARSERLSQRSLRFIDNNDHADGSARIKICRKIVIPLHPKWRARYEQLSNLDDPIHLKDLIGRSAQSRPVERDRSRRVFH